MGIIGLKNIYTAYEGGDKPVIRDVSMDVGHGEFVVIGGPNGSGKTTLLESINGMVRITHGSATVCGLDVRQQGIEVRKKVGYVLQSFYFDPFTPFTVEQVVRMGRYGQIGLLKKPAHEDLDAAEKAIRAVGIEDLANKPIGTLSGGQQQKALIAQNIARNTELLLLDEPFSNLDFGAREHVNDILKGLAKKGRTIMMVSHAFDGLPDMRIRIVVMDNGRIVHDGACRAGEVAQIVRAVA